MKSLYKKLCVNISGLFFLLVLMLVFGFTFISSARAESEGNFACEPLQSQPEMQQFYIGSDIIFFNAQEFKLDSDATINQIQIKHVYKYGSPTGGLIVNLWQPDKGTFVSSNPLQPSDVTHSYGTSPLPPVSPVNDSLYSNLTFTFNTPQQITAGQTYYFSLDTDQSPNAGNFYIVLGNQAYYNPAGACNYRGSDAGVWQSFNNGSTFQSRVYWYDFIFNIGYNVAQADIITITSPTDNQYIPKAGNYTFTGDYINSQLIYGIGALQIHSNDTSSTQNYIIYNPYWSASGTWSQVVPLAQGHYSALAGMVSLDQVYFKYSNSVFFDVATSSRANRFMRCATEAEICGDIATSTFFGGIECGLKKAGVWATCPNMATIDNFQNSYDSLKASFPFSVFYQLTDTVNSAIASTTLSDEGIGVPMIRKTSTGTEYYIAPVLASTTLASAVGQDNANLIRISLGWMMWIGLASLFYIQFRTI